MSSDFASLSSIATLAQTGASQPPVPGAVGAGSNTTAAPGTQAVPGGPPPGQQQGFPGGFMWILILGMAAVLLMSSLTGRKQEKQRKAMLAAVKRGDRVQTVGGILGTIIELTDQEMLLRVDDGSNTRIRFARSALQQVLREAKEPAKGDVEAKPRSEVAPVK